MDEKIREIEKWRGRYPEICVSDGLWQTAPKHFHDGEILIAIRSIDTLLSHISTLESQLKEVEERMKELEPDALYLRKWKEIRGSNPEVPCACQIDEEGNWLVKCAFHEDIVNQLEQRIKELENREKDPK